MVTWPDAEMSYYPSMHLWTCNTWNTAHDDPHWRLIWTLEGFSIEVEEHVSLCPKLQHTAKSLSKQVPAKAFFIWEEVNMRWFRSCWTGSVSQSWPPATTSHVQAQFYDCKWEMLSSSKNTGELYHRYKNISALSHCLIAGLRSYQSTVARSHPSASLFICATVPKIVFT